MAKSSLSPQQSIVIHFVRRSLQLRFEWSYRGRYDHSTTYVTTGRPTCVCGPHTQVGLPVCVLLLWGSSSPPSSLSSLLSSLLSVMSLLQLQFDASSNSTPYSGNSNSNNNNNNNNCDARLCRASYSNKLWYKMFY